MVRQGAIRWALAASVGLGAWSATATANQLTGFVENDFKAGPGSGIVVIPHSDDPFHLGQPKWMTDRGWVNGWSIKDIRLGYDKGTDTLYVGVNTFGVAGNVDGNGTPGTPDPLLTKSGGIDPLNFGGDKSITVAFAPYDPTKPSATPAAPLFVAGVPADKTQAGTGLNGFNVAAFNGTGNGIEYGFGKTMTAQMGSLAFDPTAAHPGFEFSIANFSKIPGVNLQDGFWLSAYAGSYQGVVAGKDFVPWTRVASPAGQTVPEPTTMLAWSLALGGSALYARRRAKS